MKKDFNPQESRIAFLRSSDAVIAHIIVDPQRIYCDPDYDPHDDHDGDPDDFSDYDQLAPGGTEETLSTCDNISDMSIALNMVEAHNILVYSDPDSEGIDRANGGLMFSSDEIDHDLKCICLSKENESAFESTDLAHYLDDLGVNIVLISGFNTGSCVLATVHDSLKHGFKTVLITDCTANDMVQEDNISYDEAIANAQELGAKTLSMTEIKEGLSLNQIDRILESLPDASAFEDGPAND